MSLTVEQIKRALSNCQVLIVEDNATLARRIAELFRAYSSLEPDLAHYMDQAREIVSNDQKRFDLILMDVLLPETYEDYQQVKEFEQTLERLRELIERYGTSPQDRRKRDKLATARYRRAQALRQMQDLIDRDGGIKLVEEWYQARSSQSPAFVTLYLTAVGNDAAIQRGLSAARGRADWIIKPASSDMILEKSVSLLLKSGFSSGI